MGWGVAVITRIHKTQHGLQSTQLRPETCLLRPQAHSAQAFIRALRDRGRQERQLPVFAPARSSAGSGDLVPHPASPAPDGIDGTPVPKRLVGATHKTVQPGLFNLFSEPKPQTYTMKTWVNGLSRDKGLGWTHSTLLKLFKGSFSLLSFLNSPF